MAWTTPTLKDVRRMVRDNVTAALRATAMAPNSVTRVLADAKAALAHLVLLYADWIAKQVMPDTAETEWLARHGVIWLENADGSKGRKAATTAAGSVNLTGTAGTVVPSGTRMVSSANVLYATTADVTLGAAETVAEIEAVDAGKAGNLDAGYTLTLTDVVAGCDGQAIVVELTGGADEESDDDLRERILFRIQEPPMGGSAADYERWSKAVAGVTRVWVYPNEMDVGSVTVRFLMDELRSGDDGMPTADDIDAVQTYLDSVRPVTVKDLFVEAPIFQTYDITISDLESDTTAVRAAIVASIKAMEIRRAKPGQTMFRSWVDEAVSAAVGEDSHELTFTSAVMDGPGYMPKLGSITFA